jgi:hypothetical protein
VTRERTDREAMPSEVAAGDLMSELESLVRSAVAEGAVTLAEVTARVFQTLAPTVHYASAGHIADTVARLVRARVDRERPWTPVNDRLEIENWALVVEDA